MSTTPADVSVSEASPDAGVPCVPGGATGRTKLSETGLFADIATKTIACDVLPFEPEFKLWSDAAEKKRWVRLPPGTSIDTTDPDHDKGENGSAVTTHAIYGHGKSGSIREAFAARGVTPTSIIGSVVTQGQVIMKAGDTGMSFHNHTHLEVRTGSTLDPATSYTIPIVFREAGALEKLTWYTSANAKVA